MSREIRKSRKTYVSKCYDLAFDFLSDEPEIMTHWARDELAIRIQETIEDFIAECKQATP